MFSPLKIYWRDDFVDSPNLLVQATKNKDRSYRVHTSNTEPKYFHYPIEIEAPSNWLEFWYDEYKKQSKDRQITFETAYGPNRTMNFSDNYSGPYKEMGRTFSATYKISIPFSYYLEPRNFIAYGRSLSDQYVRNYQYITNKEEIVTEFTKFLPVVEEKEVGSGMGFYFKSPKPIVPVKKQTIEESTIELLYQPNFQDVRNYVAELPFTDDMIFVDRSVNGLYSISVVAPISMTCRYGFVQRKFIEANDISVMKKLGEKLIDTNRLLYFPDAFTMRWVRENKFDLYAFIMEGKLIKNG